MSKPARTFKARAFVSLVMVLAGLGLPVTGIVNHALGFAPLTVERHAWMSAHNALGALFVVCALWHVVLNRRALAGHLKDAVARMPALSRELLLASAVVAVTLLFFVGHAVHAGH